MTKHALDMNQICSDLEGTCKDINDVLPDGLTLEDLTPQQCAELDSNVLCCAACGWWVPSDEIVENDICDECHNEELDVDDE